jgi:peptide/nickel transport system permease protein
MTNLILVLGAIRGITMARLLRSEVLRVSQQDFVTAARALGLPARAVLGRHVLPHVLSPVLVSAAFTAAAVVALESALSFLGLGLPAGQASWGVLLGRLTGPAVIGPTLGILALSGALYALADGLDEALSGTAERHPVGTRP